MAQIQQFEEIIAWQKAKVITTEVYIVSRSIDDRSYNDQIQRAAVSIMNNIAEGFERKSNKEFRQFLYIAKGSCGEVRSMIILGKEIGYISTPKAAEMTEKCLEISRLLSGFIKKL
jgi:four helix bundle protein